MLSLGLSPPWRLALPTPRSRTRIPVCGNPSPRILPFPRVRRMQELPICASNVNDDSGWGDEVEGEAPKWDHASSEALLQGGQEVVSVLESMIKVLEDVTGLDKDAEETAIKMAAVAAVGQRLDKLDGSFLAALELMIARSQHENDPKRKELLDIIKETTLAQLTAKASPEVQIVAILCQAPDKEHRRQIMRRAAGGGGFFQTSDGGKINIPGGNMLNIANQADDIITSMEEKQSLPDRKLLSKLILIRELAHDMLGGGILDERNKPVLKELPQPEVDFIGKLVAVRPGPSLREKVSNVLRGRDEGADSLNEKDKMGAVRPGMFLETVKKLLDGMYDNRSAAGITVQHLDWVYRTGLDILQDIAFGKYGTD